MIYIKRKRSSRCSSAEVLKAFSFAQVVNRCIFSCRFWIFRGSSLLADGSFLFSSSGCLLSLVLMDLVRSDLCSCEGCNSDFAGDVHHHRIWLIGYPFTSAAHRSWWGTVPPGSYAWARLWIFSGSVLLKNTQKLKFHLCIRTWDLCDHLTGLSVSISLMMGLSSTTNFSQKSKTHLISCSVCGFFWSSRGIQVGVPERKQQEVAAARGSMG